MKQVIRLTEDDLHRIVEDTIQEVVSELGSKKYGMLGGRRWVNGEDDSDIRDHVVNNGGNMMDYAIGKVEYMGKNPKKVGERVGKEWHRIKNKKGA